METISINLAEAGTKAMRFLANIHHTHPKSCHIDLRGTNEKNIFMMGRDGCIGLILDIIRMHLDGAKVRALLKQRFAKITAAATAAIGGGGKGDRRRQYNLDGNKDIQARRKAKREKHNNLSEEEISKRIIYVALESLYCLASADYTHPNRAIMEGSGLLETALDCCNVLPGELRIFQWACTLLSMLYSR